MKTVILFPLVLAFILIGCRTINTSSDTTDPELYIYHIDENGGNDLISSTDPNAGIVALGCPGPIAPWQFNPSAFITDIENGTVSLNVTSSDQGAVRNLNLFLSPIQISDVSNLTVFNMAPETQIVFTQNGPLEVKIEITFANLRTAQIVTFDVTGLEQSNILTIGAESSDFNSHVGSIPSPADGIIHAQIIDISACDED